MKKVYRYKKEYADAISDLSPCNFSDVLNMIIKSMNFEVLHPDTESLEKGLYMEDFGNYNFLIIGKDYSYVFIKESDPLNKPIRDESPTLPSYPVVSKEEISVDDWMFDECDTDAIPGEFDFIYFFSKLHKKPLSLSSKFLKSIKSDSKRPQLTLVYQEDNYPYWEYSGTNAFTTSSRIMIKCNYPKDKLFREIIKYTERFVN